MSHILPTFLAFAAAFGVMLVSFSGALFASKTLGGWMRPRLPYLATFSTGVLSILAYHLIGEAFEEAPSASLAAGSILAGVIILEIIHLLLPDAHHHHEPTEHPHTRLDGRRVLLSDAVHNVTDGFLIVPAFLVDWKIGLAATAGIVLHEFVQEISEFFVLKQAGYETRRALLLNFAASSTILVGVTLALVLASFETVLSLLAGFAAGGFLSVVVRDLLPHAVSSAKASRSWTPHILAALIGAGIMFGITTLAPHEERGGSAGPSARAMYNGPDA